MEPANPLAACRRPRAWVAARLALLVAAVSLACFIPFRYATDPPPVRGLYGYLFPLSGLIALTGMALAMRPGLAFRMPPAARAGAAALGVAWMATGVVCLSSLTAMMMKMPLPGLFATFHMLVQHVFLPLAVGGFALAPRATYAIFGFELAPVPRQTGTMPVPSEA